MFPGEITVRCYGEKCSQVMVRTEAISSQATTQYCAEANTLDSVSKHVASKFCRRFLINGTEPHPLSRKNQDGQTRRRGPPVRAHCRTKRSHVWSSRSARTAGPRAYAISPKVCQNRMRKSHAGTIRYSSFNACDSLPFINSRRENFHTPPFQTESTAFHGNPPASLRTKRHSVLRLPPAA